ncbi:unnamed protein product [Orchesella dallaii]|uniref:Uncharacterized protein n=1 Tax=Orchesella dallaii TaxID=48710 RepID=A0ABP1RZT3_9HEXA
MTNMNMKSVCLRFNANMNYVFMTHVFQELIDESLIERKITRHSTHCSVNKVKCKNHIQFIVNDHWAKLPDNTKSINNLRNYKKEKFIFNKSNVNQIDFEEYGLSCIDDVINSIINRTN